MIGHADIKRKPETDEYYLGKAFMFKLVPHEVHPKMFYYEDFTGTRSEDFFNATRAATNGRKVSAYLINTMESITLEGQNKPF